MGEEPGIILATSYLPPVGYFENIYKNERIFIEAHEHFVKQTIRNRCHILSPNGIQTLIIPVNHNNRFRIPVKDLRISNEINWQRNHWRSLNAAYRRSAFFEFYMDELEAFYSRKFEFLFDFNYQLLKFLLKNMGIHSDLKITLSYSEPSENRREDFRSLSETGMPVNPVKEISYPQVFGFKNGFVNGLSIVDLLFNMGPRTADYLK